MWPESRRNPRLLRKYQLAYQFNGRRQTVETAGVPILPFLERGFLRGLIRRTIGEHGQKQRAGELPRPLLSYRSAWVCSNPTGFRRVRQLRPLIHSRLLVLSQEVSCSRSRTRPGAGFLALPNGMSWDAALITRGLSRARGQRAARNAPGRPGDMHFTHSSHAFTYLSTFCRIYSSPRARECLR